MPNPKIIGTEFSNIFGICQIKWFFGPMEHKLYYSILTLIRQDIRLNRNAYIWQNNLPTKETINHVKEMVGEKWPVIPEGTTLEELEEVAISEVKGHTPTYFNPKTGKYE